MEGRPGTNEDPQCPASLRPVKCVKLNQSVQANKSRLPKGLIGSKCTAQVRIAGQECQCLLDTGSQVTTIPVSFYNTHLSHQPVLPLCDLLQVEGAAGQSIPYLGYIKVTVTFPKDFLGTEFDVNTLALVVPDVRPELQSQILIGMNTLDPLYELYATTDFANFQPVMHGYRAVLNLLQLRHQRSQEGSDGVVRVPSDASVVVPAGHTVVVEGSVHTNVPPAGEWALVEHPATPLPGGLCVRNCLVTLPRYPKNRVAVVLTNESEHNVTLSPLTTIAELVMSPQILSHHVTSESLQSKDTPEDALKFDFGDSPIPLEWRERFIQTLKSIPEVFAHHDLDFGRTDKVKHRIHLHDETAFKHRARPVHPNDIEAVRKHLRDLLDAGVIRESESSFSSPIVVVRKKNGDVRLCIDYRKLNMQTVKDVYPLPNLEESFSALTGSRWFSVLDLKSGYYQIEVEEADKAKTAFVTPLGFWEFNRMPQGVTNAPSTFQRLMEKCMGDLHLKDVLVFLDDLIIFSETLDEHERRLVKVLHRLREYGLKLSLEKCKFAQTSVRYLGHVVSEKGVETDPEKVSALKSWPTPRTLRELRSFLGFSGYYRRFISGYATIAKPLNDLTRGYIPARRSIPKHTSTPTGLDAKHPFGERWTPKCQTAFETLIERLTTAPVLGFANPKLPYILHTDASTTGLGAALYQEQDGQLRVIAYASRGLSASESRYPAHKLEFLALKWSVTEKFHDYLYGSTFVVITDNNPLTYILTSAKLDAASHRWLAALSTYNFKLQYRAGRQNLDADALSRRPHSHTSDEHLQKEWNLIRQFAQEHCTDEAAEISQEVVATICLSSLVRSSPCSAAVSPVTLVESMGVSADVMPEGFANETLHGLPVIPSLSSLDLKEKQREDPCIREVIYQIETGTKVPPTAKNELPDLAILLRELNRLELHDDVLYRRRQDGEQTVFQLVLPETLRPTVLNALHCDMGHMGIERTLDLIRSRFFWPRMASNVETKIKTCPRCVRRKALPERAAQLVNIKTTRPLELLCMDYLSIEPDKSNIKDVLVLTDHFTKYAVAIPTANQKARTVAKCLWENFIVHYGIPERLHTDQGPDFESKLIRELCDLAGIQKTRTTPYHPRGNPVERFNRTLLSMLGTLEHKQKATWKEYVRPLVHAYNCTRNEVTGFTPYELMFGRSPRLPVDLAFGLPAREPSSKSHSQYVQGLRSRLEASYQLALRNSEKSAERNKSRFDQKVTPSSLEEGDRVLVRNVRLRGKHKLEDKWERDVYVVVKRAGKLPVYTVRPEIDVNGPCRTLHRDLLLPCGFLPASEDVHSPTGTPARKPRTRSQPQAEESDGNLEEDELDVPHFHIQPTVKEVFRLPEAVVSEPRCTVPVCQTLPSAVPDLSPEPTIVSPVNSEPALPPITDHLPDAGDLSAAPEGLLPVEEPDPVTYSSESNGSSLTSETDGELPEDDYASAGQAEAPPSPTNEPLDPSETPAKDTLSDTHQSEDVTIRRSSRQRQPPNRLQYSALGNPLVSVVQTLLHSLADAYNEVFTVAPPSVDFLQPRIQVV